MTKSARTLATDISQKVRAKVFERDNGCCIICGARADDYAHVISKAPSGIGSGLGIPENVVCLCRICHTRYDSRKKHITTEDDIKIAEYMTEQYNGWNKMNLVYKKGM
jgi:5-methylcytosine-specific restriction endonuclease McrA